MASSTVTLLRGFCVGIVDGRLVVGHTHADSPACTSSNTRALPQSPLSMSLTRRALSWNMRSISALAFSRAACKSSAFVVCSSLAAINRATCSSSTTVDQAASTDWRHLQRGTKTSDMLPQEDYWYPQRFIEATLRDDWQGQLL